MILQALTHYYEDLLNLGTIARPGWNLSKISYGLLLDDDGHLVQLLHLQQEVSRGKKMVLAPQEYFFSGITAAICWAQTTRVSPSEPPNVLQPPGNCI